MNAALYAERRRNGVSHFDVGLDAIRNRTDLINHGSHLPGRFNARSLILCIILNPAVRPRRSRQTAMFSLPRDVPRLHPLGEVRSSCDAQ